MPRCRYQFGEFQLDSATGALFKNGSHVHLRPKAVETLRVLVESNGRVVSKEELIQRVWLGSFVEEGGLARNICDLRKILSQGRGSDCITTVPKCGYCFSAPVTAVQAETPPAPIRVAILPLRGLGGQDATDEGLCLEIADALITRLELLRGFTVVSSIAAKDEGDPILAGRRLGVDYVLAGNVQRQREEVRIGAHLLDVRSARSIWAEVLREHAADAGRLEISVAEEIAGAVGLALGAAERKLTTRRYSESAQAYQLYLRGRYHWHLRSAEGLRKAVALFERALDKDPEYAPAYSGLADCYAMLPMMASLPARRYMPRAKAAALNALDIDPALKEARASLAFVRWHYDWNWSGAEREFQRLLRHFPQDAVTHQWYALLLAELGRKGEAVAHAYKAHHLSPMSPVVHANLATVLHLAGREQDAVKEAGETLAADPNSVRAHWALGMALESLGRFEEARIEFESACRLSASMPAALGSLGHLHATCGRRDEARTVLARLQAVHGAAYSRALVHLALGEHAAALDALEDACAERSFYVVLLKVDSRFEPLRHDPRFQGILKQLRLA